MTTTQHNRAMFLECQESLNTLISPYHKSYVTVPETKLEVPIFGRCLGINVITTDNPIPRDHRAMLRVDRNRDRIKAKLWAVSHGETFEYLRAGVTHGVGDNRFRELVGPDEFDGYELTASRHGDVTVEGLVHEGNGRYAHEPLHVFDREFPQSGEAFLASIHISLHKRAEKAREARQLQ